jgi:hypothetical protein
MLDLYQGILEEFVSAAYKGQIFPQPYESFSKLPPMPKVCDFAKDKARATRKFRYLNHKNTDVVCTSINRCTKCIEKRRTWQREYARKRRNGK